MALAEARCAPPETQGESLPMGLTPIHDCLMLVMFVGVFWFFWEIGRG